MKKEWAASIVAGFCLSSIGAAGAANFAAAAKVSTLGLGVEVTTNLLPDVNARVGFNTFNREKHSVLCDFS